MRKKVRKSLAFLLALALVVSVMSGLGLSVSADDAQNEPVVTETEGEPAEEKLKAEENTSAEGGKEETADPDAETVPEEKKDEQKAEGEGSGEKAAENKDAATPKAGENVQTATIGTGDKTVTVKTTAAAGVLPEGAKLVVKKLANQDQAYQDAESTLKDSQVTYDDFLALDVGFEVNGKEVEPEAGSVQVQFELGAGLLPETADTSTLAVQHLTDGKAETVADAGAVTAGDVTVKNEVVKADFEVKSFSSFTITWKDSNKTYTVATIHYVDEKGAEISASNVNVQAVSGQTLDLKKEYGHSIDRYTYSTARYKNAINGTEVTSIVMKDHTQQLLGINGNVVVDDLTASNNIDKNIYLIYTENTEGGHTGPSQILAHEKYVTANNDHTYDLNLTVSGKKGSKTSKAKVDVLFILDRSGSMRFGMNNSNQNADAPNRRIDKVADAVNTLTTNLKDNENIDARYSVVSFADTATTDQNWTSSAGAAYAAVAKATPNGGTNYQAGIYQAKEQLKSSRSGAQTMVIFLTDGAPTYRGKTTASGGGGYTHQDDINAAKTELAGMTADGFYCVGVMLDSSIDVYTGDVWVDWGGNPHGTSSKKTGKAILQEVIAGGTSIKDKPDPMMASDPKALNDAFDKIEAKITDLLCDHVIVTDVLSENVKMVTNSETDTTPKKLVVTIKKNNEAGTIVAGPATSVTDEGYTITAKYDAAAKQITLDFPTNYTLNPDYTYIVTATIEATEKAYENVRANKVNTGDAGTGDTSAGKKGVYSNKLGEAKVSYKYNDSDKTEDYNKPVIQPEPAKLIVKKTISGLESLSDEQIKALEEKMTFNITYTYPTGNQNTVTETKKLSDFTKNDDGTYTYTSDDIWSMGATYEVTETGYPVTGYDRAATPTNASGSIPKYSTATATFTNAYTPSNRIITLKKVVGGNMRDPKDEFTFTYGDKQSVTLNGGDNNTKEIEVPYGSSFTVTESDKGGYTLEKIEATGSTGTRKDDTYTIEKVTEDTTITFTNDKTINPPSGITTTIAPYAIMVVLAAGAGVYFVYSRRRRNR